PGRVHALPRRRPHQGHPGHRQLSWVYSFSIGAWRRTIDIVWSPKSICAWARAPVPSTASTRPTPQRWWVTRSPATRPGTFGSSLAVVKPAADTPSRSASFDAFGLPGEVFV